MKESQNVIIQQINRQLKDVTIEELKQKRGGLIKFPVILSKEFEDADVNELDLSTRSFNCVKRAGIGKVGQLVSCIQGRDDLLRIRNLGKKSADEIMYKLFLFHYSTLKQDRRDAYIERIKNINQVAR